MAGIARGYRFEVEEVPLSKRYAMSKQALKEIAEETLRSCSEGRYLNQEGCCVELQLARAIETTRLYPEGESLAKVQRRTPAAEGLLPSEECVVSVALCSTLSAAEGLVRRGLRTAVLNFASAKNPGGGFLRGANAQEESLARSSGLYPCLLKAEVQAYYRENACDDSCVYTENMIMSPEVPVFRTDDGGLLGAPYLIGVLTAPAPNMGVAADRRSSGGAEQIRAVRRQRMARLLHVLAAEDFEAVVLGAWGCGVFRNDPWEVAQEFRELLGNNSNNNSNNNSHLARAFRHIVFAVIDEPTHSIFQRVLCQPASGDAAGISADFPSAGGGKQERGNADNFPLAGGGKKERKSRRWLKRGDECPGNNHGDTID
ncbi:unnamed protein product [Polarella glacialis]|uniref:Microbial-type PARG catalytic domain-containing protein n=1 Tax=Polarella glacialis TaxID=89957 RepID=A0A813HE93_POLGL|nr:unnamed protein product [Polarella glacialis]